MDPGRADYGLWIMDYRLPPRIIGLWIMDYRLPPRVKGLRIMGYRLWIMCVEARVVAVRPAPPCKTLSIMFPCVCPCLCHRGRVYSGKCALLDRFRIWIIDYRFYQMGLGDYGLRIMDYGL